METTEEEDVVAVVVMVVMVVYPKRLFHPGRLLADGQATVP